jgi:hypothetical protein
MKEFGMTKIVKVIVDLCKRIGRRSRAEKDEVKDESEAWWTAQRQSDHPGRFVALGRMVKGKDSDD